MVRFEQLARNPKFKDADYVFDDEDTCLQMMDRLTPKIGSAWIIYLVDPSLAFVRAHIADAKTIPDFVDCVVYVHASKMDSVFEMCPWAKLETLSMWDQFKQLVAELDHPMNKNAYSYLYNSIGPNYDELKEALEQLDTECEEDTITLAQVKKSYLYTKRIYARDVLEAFVGKRSNRWNTYSKYVKELGLEIAYYALRKQITTALIEKCKYLNNEQTKNKLALGVDAATLSYMYFVFNNSSSFYELPGLMYKIDNRTKSTVERILE